MCNNCPHNIKFGPLQPHVEESVREEQQKKIEEIAQKIKEQKESPPEFTKTVDTHFWKLFDSEHKTNFKRGECMEPDVKNYEKTFPKYPATIKDEKTGWIHGTWMIGNNFRSKHGYYGEYPPSYLDRLYSLFPKAKNVLHLFSGTVEKGRWKKETTIDINPDLKPDIVNDAHKLSEIFSEECFDLILADPPYSEEDAKHYGTCLISRNKVIKEAQIILKTNGIISWLDQVFPMYRKKELTLIGTIGIWRSTNYRFRGLSIFKKEKL